VEPRAHVVQPALADPPDARLQCLERGQEQVPARARLAPAERRRVRIARAPALAAVPRRLRQTHDGVHRRAFVGGRDRVEKAKVHVWIGG